LVTQKQIATKLGISQSAVACAFHPTLHRNISPRKRQHILNTAGRLGYVPNHAARRLIRSRFRKPANPFDQVGLIYLVSTDIDLDRFCIAIMRGAEHELSKFHASLTFVRANEPSDWKKVDRMVQAGSVDGWLLVGTVNDAVASRLKRDRLPFVILGDHQCTQPVHCVNVDNTSVGRVAVQHLAALGHRRIGFMGGSMRHVYQRQTLEGFRAAVKELGLDDDERLITEHSSWNRTPNGGMVVEFNQELVIQWLRDSRATALFLPEFHEASEMWRVLKQSQLEVPRDISLLACEQSSLESKSQNFTRIEMSMIEVGRRGASMLQELALAATQPESGSRPDFGSVKIAPSLIEGWSTARCEAQKTDDFPGAEGMPNTMRNAGEGKIE